VALADIAGDLAVIIITAASASASAAGTQDCGLVRMMGRHQWSF